MSGFTLHVNWYFHDMFNYFVRPVPGNYEFVVIKSWLLKEEEKIKKEILTRTTSVAAALCNAFVQINNKEMDSIIQAIFEFFCEFFISVWQWVNCMGKVLNFNIHYK